MSMKSGSTAMKEDKLAEFRQKLSAEAEELVLVTFPQRVKEFDGMLTSEKYSLKRLPDILPSEDLGIALDNSPENGSELGEPSSKRQKISSSAVKSNGFAGVVPPNIRLGEMMQEMRPLIRTALENVNTVKMWITLLIPRIEDGNNFGVGIQEETLSEVRTVESEAASYMDDLSRYFVSRAKLLTKVAKYPAVMDYRRAILDMDEKQFINIRIVLTELRNHFAMLHDVITKNLEKIKKPRNSNHETMY